ncbi:unnamed protein product [Sphenostylis stenocarpa]|uniref:Non-specific lipid-transfer protein n=1 Tax=Sphenostylis stenocarpa TaxID=92480 RepID=A0AA86S043_9FABA|nr:unnamed protein product [Sphenostylis stenocarpa]
MASSQLLKVTCMVVVLMVGLGEIIPLAEAAIPCGTVQFTLASCIAFLRGPGGPVPAACCNGVKSLNNQAKTTADRQGACTCLKNTALAIPGLNLRSLATLPSNCGVNLPYKISPSIDCST